MSKKKESNKATLSASGTLTLSRAAATALLTHLGKDTTREHLTRIWATTEADGSWLCATDGTSWFAVELGLADEATIPGHGVSWHGAALRTAVAVAKATKVDMVTLADQAGTVPSGIRQEENLPNYAGYIRTCKGSKPAKFEADANINPAYMSRLAESFAAIGHEDCKWEMRGRGAPLLAVSIPTHAAPWRAQGVVMPRRWVD